MALSDILKAKSSEEQHNLRSRGFVETGVGGKWKFKMSISPILLAYEDTEDTEDFKNGLIELLNNVLGDIETYIHMSNDDEDTEYEMSEYENIIEELNMLDEHPEESEIDYVMNILYDFADNNDIWIESVDM